MKVFVRVKGWEPLQTGKLKVFYSTWDGKCLCTSRHYKRAIDLPPGDLDKKSISLAILKQLHDD